MLERWRGSVWQGSSRPRGAAPSSGGAHVRIERVPIASIRLLGKALREMGKGKQKREG